MSLQNLVGISLEPIDPSAKTIQQLIAAAERNIADSQVKAISTETRFDAAYKAIMQLANAALQANGFRTLTSKPGHHKTMIQTLPQTVGLEQENVIVLDALRKQRNIADYSGDLVPTNTVHECVRQSKLLLETLKQWLKTNRPALSIENGFI